MPGRPGHPIESWSDEELWDQLRALRAGGGTPPGGLEPEAPQTRTIEEIEEELQRRGQDPAGS
ncbi:MAG: hypothetical protein M3N51_12525 [Actinomycetota bacterium]|nr:hypothetical protein [Actinomycetota bacterium]